MLAVASVGSAAYVAGQTLNYLNYYSALSQLAVEIHALSAQSFPQSNVTVTVDFVVSNPTPYVGLLVRALSYTAMAQLDNGSRPVVIAAPTVNSNGDGHLGPNSSIHLISRFVLTDVAMTQFQQLCASQNRTLAWAIDGNIALVTRDGDLSPQFGLSPTSSC